MTVFRSLILLGVCGVFVLIGIGIGGFLWISELHAAPAPGRGEPVAVHITPGMAPPQIGFLLKTQGLIRSALAFKFLVGLYAVDTRLKPGKYRFTPGAPIESILHVLLKGQEELVKVTIPEGKTLEQIGTLVAEAGVCSASAFLQAIGNPTLREKAFPAWGPLSSAEGLAFPETYTLAQGTPPEEIAQIMVELTRNRVQRTLPASAANGLTPYESCILASIVEREARLPEERPLVASVFLNRLRKGMRLESCATVQFALPEHKERLLLEDLKIESPYNTYLQPGLPPTPIANFGEASLAAVASPTPSDFLYFVSDASEGHRFSRTLAEHEQFRREFFRERKRAGRRN